VVESYQSLQEDHTQTTVDLLRQISRQLANPSSPAAPEPAQFQAQRSDVQVNVCWFVSLLLSLFVALFGIFLKQWMRAYMKWTDVKPDREAVALRQFRYRGLESWRPGAILTLLPTLLQLSLILFLSGLLVFLWNIDLMVAHVMAGLSAIAFFLVALVTALPVFARSCPYRSPLSEILALSLWRAISIVGSAIKVSIQSGFTHAPETSRWVALTSQWRERSKTTPPASWVQADEVAIHRYHSNNRCTSMDLSAMVHLCCTTQSQPLWSAAITAIVTTATTRTTGVFYKEVWWPVFEHITLFHENKHDPQHGYTQLFQRTSSQFTHFSSSMKHCWVNFVLQLKSFASRSKSPRVVESYLLCCIASMESITGDPCGLALMEILKARARTLDQHVLDRIASSLYIHASTRASPTIRDPKSGLSFADILSLDLNTRNRPPIPSGHTNIWRSAARHTSKPNWKVPTDPCGAARLSSCATYRTGYFDACTRRPLESPDRAEASVRQLPAIPGVPYRSQLLLCPNRCGSQQDGSLPHAACACHGAADRP
jgi:hypothetical protein